MRGSAKRYSFDREMIEITVAVPKSELSDHLLEQMSLGYYMPCDLLIEDGRTITRKQRMKIYAILGDICDYTGFTLDEMKVIQKAIFRAEKHYNKFSLSNCGLQIAREFIEYILEWAFMEDIPLSGETIEQCKDIKNYVYLCTIKRLCVVCGKQHAQIHHATETVGSGRNRTEISHIGYDVLPLCQAHHNEAHNTGLASFNKKYCLVPVKVDVRINKMMRGR